MGQRWYLLGTHRRLEVRPVSSPEASPTPEWGNHGKVFSGAPAPLAIGRHLPILLKVIGLRELALEAATSP